MKGIPTKYSVLLRDIGEVFIKLLPKNYVFVVYLEVWPHNVVGTKPLAENQTQTLRSQLNWFHK